MKALRGRNALPEVFGAQGIHMEQLGATCLPGDNVNGGSRYAQA